MLPCCAIQTGNVTVNNEDTIRFHRHAVPHLSDRYPGHPCQELWKDALMRGVEVLDQNTGEAHPGGELLQ